MNKYFAQVFSLKSVSILALSISLVGCGNGSWWSNDEPTLEVEHIRKAIPGRVSQRESWAQDIYDITDQLGIPQTKENICSIVAVVDQESNFNADPVVPGLGEKPLKKFRNVWKKNLKINLVKVSVEQLQDISRMY